MPTIHPTAIVDSGATLADSVVIGPFCIVESDVTIGAGTELRSHAVVRRHTTLGRGNLVDSHCVLGGLPQDLKFDPDHRTEVRIGDDNIFREGVTISRATHAETPTTVGSSTYWMANTHAGHDTVVGDRAVLVNNAAIGGHAAVGPRAIMGGAAMIHQFTWVGELVMMRGKSGASMHVPPFCMTAGVNNVVGLNTVGLRRAEDITDEGRRQVADAFRLTYRRGKSPRNALEDMDGWTDIAPAAERFREFLRRVVQAEPPYDRGLCPHRRSRQ